MIEPTHIKRTHLLTLTALQQILGLDNKIIHIDADDDVVYITTEEKCKH